MSAVTDAVICLAVGFAAAPLAAQGGAGLADLTRTHAGRSRAVTSSAADFNSNADRRTYITPGETMVLADIAGPGVINHIWLTFNDARPNWLEAGGSADPAEIVLRMYWDGAEAPAVEAPLGDFFAAGFGLRREVRSVPIQVQGGDAYNSFWQMPFFTRARITVTNESARNVRSFYYQIDYTAVDTLPPATAYFCAQYRREFPETAGRDYLVLDARGDGHYVGTVMSVRSRSPFWFGEGDARIYVDGDTLPTIQGTGTEDYFLSAWGFEPHLFPYFGVTYLSGDPSDLGFRATMYRWHIDDPIRFTRSLRFTLEHTGWMSADETATGAIDGHVEREDDVATVAFWYQAGQPRRFTTLPAVADRTFPSLDRVIDGEAMLAGARHSPGTLELQQGYDWTGRGQLFFVPSSDTAFLEVRFQVADSALAGLVLRMTYAPDYGRFRILLDGTDVTALPDYPDWRPRGPVDFFAPQVDVRDLYLGSYALSRGAHVLRFATTERGPQSSGNRLGFDSVRLRARWHKRRASLRPATP
jgi:D-arabinan exo alpha-(1,3)/(1,5)-arabinofuranosidase (non-reducing end)